MFANKLDFVSEYDKAVWITSSHVCYFFLLQHNNMCIVGNLSSFCWLLYDIRPLVIPKNELNLSYFDFPNMASLILRSPETFLTNNNCGERNKCKLFFSYCESLSWSKIHTMTFTLHPGWWGGRRTPTYINVGLLPQWSKCSYYNLAQSQHLKFMNRLAWICLHHAFLSAIITRRVRIIISIDYYATWRNVPKNADRHHAAQNNWHTRRMLIMELRSCCIIYQWASNKERQPSHRMHCQLRADH